ncbi:hypothetical protein D3C77_450790 [compost metagenome]
MAGREQVGEEMVGESVHRIGQFQLADIVTGPCLHSLMQGRGVPGDVGQQRPFTEVIPVTGSQFQVPAQGEHWRDEAAATSDLVPFFREAVAQLVVGFMRLAAVFDRLAGGGDFSLHYRKDLAGFIAGGGQYGQ